MIFRAFVFIMITVWSLYGSEVVWLHDYAKARTLSQKTGKPIYIMITSQNCKWCRKFENETLQEKKITQMLFSRFITLHFIKEQDPIPTKFAYTPVPRHYIVDSKGIILGEEVGFLPSDIFAIVLENALKEREDAIHTNR